MSTRAQEDHQGRRGGERATRGQRRGEVSRGRDAHAGQGADARQDRSQPARAPHSSHAARQSGREASNRNASRRSRAGSTSSRSRSGQSAPSRALDFAARHRRPLIALGIVLVVILALYGPVQRYYVAWRTQGDEQAKADYLNADNDALKQDIDRLTTRSGVENEARARGYRYPSEDANGNEGASDGSDGSGASSDTNNASTNGNETSSTANQGSNALDEGFSYEDIQHPWYINVFDVIFSYSSPQD